jgi:hypothetical protein
MILVGKPEGKRPVGRPRCRWVDNIKMDLREIGGVVWTASIWLRIGTSEHGNELSGSKNCWELLSSCTIGGFQRRAQLHEVSVS